MNERAPDPRDVVAIPDQRHLLPIGPARNFFERPSSDEIMVKLDEGTIAEVIRSQVVVCDLFRIKAAPK